MVAYSVFYSIMLRALEKRVKIKLQDLVGSQIITDLFQGSQNMLDLAIFMIGVYLSSTCAHIKFDISLYNEQKTYYLRPINMCPEYFMVGRIQ